jgi:hypothetical protein
LPCPDLWHRKQQCVVNGFTEAECSLHISAEMGDHDLLIHDNSVRNVGSVSR